MSNEYTDKLEAFIENMHMNANYQAVMIKALIGQDDNTLEKSKLAEILFRANPDKKKPLSFFMSVPVYGVLENHGIVKYNKASGEYTLPFVLSAEQRQRIRQAMNKKIREFEA